MPKIRLKTQLKLSIGYMRWTIEAVYTLLITIYYFVKYHVFGSDSVESSLERTPGFALPSILRALGANISETTKIVGGLRLVNGRRYSNLSLGGDTRIGRSCLIDLRGPVTIGNDVTIAMDVRLISHFDAGTSYAGKVYSTSAKGIVIENGVYIGAGVVILEGVTVGQGALIAAGSLVRGNVKPYSMVAGIPAVEKSMLKMKGASESPSFKDETRN